MKKLSQAEKIRRFMKANPTKSVSETAKAMGLKYQIVYMAKRDMEKRMYKEAAEKINKKRGPVTPTMVELAQDKDGNITENIWTLPVTMHEPKSDPVNHPTHYKVGGVETIDFIEAKKFNYNLGNAVKYISRAYYKGNTKQDLQKAVWYLNREIDLFQVAENFRRGETK
jgi:hypothetical protein